MFARLGGCPPNANAAPCVPDDAKLFLAWFKSATSVQAVPFQDSVIAVTGGVPPKANAEVLLAPEPANVYLAVFKSATSVQDVPLYASFESTTEPELPPKTKPDV